MTNDQLVRLGKFNYINIETYRKNGHSVRTPLWFVIKGERIYFRTDRESGKVKRIRNNQNVRLAACDIRGKPKGPWLVGKAHLEEFDSEVFSMIRKKYGIRAILIRFFNKLRRITPIIISISIDLNRNNNTSSVEK